MRGKTAIALAIFIVAQTASAHRIDEYLQATLLSLSIDRVRAEMRMIPGVQAASDVIADIDRNGDGLFSEDEKRDYAQRVVTDLSLTVNGHPVIPQLLSWRFPLPAEMREGLGEIHIEYAAALPPGRVDRHLILKNHHQNQTSVYLMNVLSRQNGGVRITAQKRNVQQTVYELDFEELGGVANTMTAAQPQADEWDGLRWSNCFFLGMRHIREGRDHLLFLLTLLLPAPLVVSASRWGTPATLRQSVLRIFTIVTAFTVGHSLLLALAAFGIVHVPDRPIEVLIAVSIFVSAIHAWRPLLAVKEVWIAGGFGLVHGLAFASTLERLGLTHSQLVFGIVSFNLGIEAMQLLFVAAILPLLILLSRTGAYPLLRNGGAVFAAAASIGWIVERLIDVTTPVDAIVDAFARNAIWIALGLLLMGLVLSKRSSA